MERKLKSLVIHHLENVSSDILEKHPEIIRDYIKGQNGIYALYSDDKLYYVGLATDLRIRLKQHLGDRHSGLWNRFSLYLTKGDQHLRELESLVLRIASPKGNVVKTRFAGSSNLALDLNKKIKEKYDSEIAKMFGVRKKKVKKSRSTKKKVGTRKLSITPLAPYVVKRFKIQAEYKGERYIAKVLKSGKIRYNDQIYNSPSWAAKSIVTSHVNGWKFWKYRNESGQWVKLDEIRKKKPPQKPAKGQKKSREATLAPYITKGFTIQAKYKGKLYTAKVHKYGTITYNGKLYTSPSAAGSTVRGGKATDGWHFWSYKNDNGQWVKIDNLRSRKND